MVTVSRVKAVLIYDPDTGIFRWIDAILHRKHPVAGSLDTKGYRRIEIDNKIYKAHRLAWLYVTGSWPAAEIDHKNGLRDDNRFCNLREATRAENNANASRLRTNRSGYKGVTAAYGGKRWTAKIWSNGSSKVLGVFDTKEGAHLAYCAAAKALRGAFARTK